MVFVLQVMLIHDRVPTHGTVKGLAVLDWTDFESRGSSKAFMAIPFVRGTAEDGSTFPGIFAVALRSFCWNLVRFRCCCLEAWCVRC